MTDRYRSAFTPFDGPVRTALIVLATLALASCDSAGTVLDETARIAAVEQCKQVSEGAGIAAGAVNLVCNCAADKWLEKPVAERVQLDTENIQGIINECAGTDRIATPAPTASSGDSY